MKPFKNVLGKIGDFFKAVGAFLSRFFDAETSIVDNVTRIHDDFLAAKTSIEDGIAEIKAFKFNPKWKTRVINVPDAIDHLRDLYDRIFTDFKTRLAVLESPIHDFRLIFKTSSDTGADQVSGLTRTAVKIDEIATLVKQIANAMDQIKDFAALFEELVNDAETLDVLFLQQKNPRRRVDMPSVIRVGKLHE